jgi:hypothetical protein
MEAKRYGGGRRHRRGLAAAGLQVWALGHPIPAPSPFSVVDANRLQRSGVQLDQPTGSDRPAVTSVAILAATSHLSLVPIGEIKLLRLTLVGHLEGSIHQRLVWGIEMLAEPPFQGGPAAAPGKVIPQRTPRPTFWIEFYDAHDSSFIFGFAGEK